MLGLVFTLMLWAFSFALVAFFAASETAMIRLDNLTVKQLVNKQVKGAHLLEEMMESKQPLLSSLLVGTNLAVVLSTVVANLLLRDVQIGRVSGSAIASWGMIILILIFGEILPKRLATTYTAQYASKAARPIYWAYKALVPLAMPLLQIPRLLSRRLPIESDEPSMDEASLITLVDIGEEEGSVEESEREMIVRVLESNHTLVREIMTPRVDIVAIDVDTPEQTMWQEVIESGLSRIPVYEDTIDNIIGILYVKDILEYWQGPLAVSIADLMRDAYFVPETKRINDLLRELKSLRIHMAIVVDEYGGTAGLVTIEDLLEEIVGEIQDEFDVNEQAEIQQLDANTWLVDGVVPIDEISDLVEIELPDEEVDTIGGLVYWLLDYIPETGETLDLPDYGLKLTVTATSGRRITKLKIERTPVKEKQIAL
ncbi:MAG: HlyC/CorC family transporter [Firmicutes bacterium]|nr:HlyC/CorC family transporter [Bacillota bacterium]